jgi:hypothetical protein
MVMSPQSDISMFQRWGHPLASPCQVKIVSPASRLIAAQLPAPWGLSLLIAPNFSLFGCSTIAPVTHQDQANSKEGQFALAASAAPEKY